MQQWRVEEPQSIELEGVRRLEVRMVSGRVDVVGRTEDAESGAAHVEVSKLEGPLTVTLDDDGTLQIVHEKLTWGGIFDWLNGRRTEAVVAVSVPTTCPVRLGVVSADAVVSEIVAKETEVKSVSGDVTLDHVRSSVRAKTVSGDLETRRVTGTLEFETVSGDLAIAGGRTSRLAAKTVSGDLMLDVDVDSGSRVDLKTVSGDVTLRVGAECGFDVDVSSTSGRLESAFEALHVTKKPGSNKMSGRVGAADGRLKVTTVSGDVVLLARVPQ
ncbi:DUF4097 family beta strand repeat-containing protein [Kineosporia sp. R_H_3]|uniref:DUF4097 family beta strand repeat-containing protein n=1 Tax=Kineosporia sp. R_H_3 TaxID=1961848 RepID=UPI00117B2CFE|nr:DUF4097 family beta strand repeat-containing protein [Kineosporia sp. R_H_3]